MKKLYLIIVATFIFILSLIFSVFFMKVTIVTDNFETEIAINESVNYDDIYLISKSIYRTKKINVSEDMIVSSDDTTTIGQKKLIIKYNYKKYEINFNVKYRVNFVVDNETVHSQLVSSIEEVNIPTNIYKEGNELIGWLPEIPNKITTNMEFVAQFTDKPLEIPKLNSYDAVYGDLLNTIQLPYNQYGKWEFVNDVNTTVGDAGVNKFEVQFIPTNSELTVIKDYIEINVEKQTLEFKNIKLSFEYDGNEHQPIYELDQEVKVNFFGYKKIDAGTYAFSLEIDDRNYKGSYVGSYVITKASVSIKVNDVSIIFGDEIPEISYEIIGFENKELLGIEVVIPNIVHAGEYEISVKVNNPNINATIHAGNLTILKSTLDPYNPSYLNNAVYGDKLETVHFENNNPNGYWMWKDGSVIVDTPSEFKAVAIFTPNETTDYDLIERELTIIVSKKELVINVLENEYVYDGQEHSVKFIIEDGSYTDVDVIGLLTHTNVGVYENNLIINDERYQGYIYVNLVINKATPSVDFDKSYTVNWNSKLESIKLPDGYSWKNNNQVLSEIGENQLFDAIFTPSDTDNYLIVEGKIKINVVKVDSEIYADEEYILNYNGRVQKLNNVTISHDEMVELEYIYELNGNIVENLLNAGTYKVTINLPSTDHYNETSLVVKVIINKAKVMELDQLESTFGTLLEDIELPQSNYGYWEFIEKGSVKVGNAGINEHKVRFVSTDDNYESFDSNVQIKVNKKELFFAFEETNFVYNGKEQTVILSIFDKDNNEYNLADFKVIGLEKIKNVGKKELTLTIEDDNYYIDETKVTITINILLIEKPKADKSSYVYNGHEQIYQIEENIYYSINGNKQINAGEYDVVIKLIEPENVKWSDNTTDDVIYKFKINKAESKPIIPTFNSIYGDQLQSLIFPYDENGIWTWVDSLETYTGSVGQNKFKAKFVHNEEIGLDNFEDLIVDIVVNVEKRAIELPLISSKVYNGLLQKADIDINEYYTVLDYDGFINAGTHQVKLQLRNPNNYKWINTENETTIVTFEITQATTIIENLTLENWTYNENNNNPSATTNFGTIVYTYSKTLDGEYSITVPTEAGTYYVKASVEGNENYTSASITTTFTINKAIVNIPTIANVVYNGEFQIANVPSSEIYKVVENNGGTNVGEYSLVVELIDTNNYKWNNNDDNKLTLTYEILFASNNWVKTPNVEDTIYKSEIVISEYLSKFGNVVLEFKEINSDDSKYSTIIPTNAGKYIAIFKVDGTNNYSELVTIIEFEILPLAVIKPNKDTNVYTYNEQEQTYIVEENEAYKVSGNVKENAGTHNVTISLVNSNYVWDDGTTTALTYEFVINKQVVELPTINSKVYTGNKQIADVEENDLYSVVSNNGGVNTGKYLVILGLNDIVNYTWNEYKNANVELTFEITQAITIIENLTLENWTYNETNNNPSATKNFGTIVYTYSKTLDGEYSITVPTEAGTYYVKASVEGNENYTAYEDIICFEIYKLNVLIPKVNSQVYTGSLLKAEIFDTHEYNVLENNGGIEVGSYNVKLQLRDSNNYRWDNDSEEETIVIEFKIIKTLNNWIVSPSIVNPTFGFSELIINVEVMFGDIVVEYKGLSENDSKYSTQVPTNAGKYVARFSVDETADYGKLEEFVEFEILPLAVIKPNKDTNVYTYNEQEQTYIVEENEAYKVSGNVKENAGTYNVTISLVNSNYVWDDGTTTALTYEFVINKQVVELPVLSSRYYTGNVVVAIVNTNDLYEVVTNDGGIEVGKYDVVLKLTQFENYKWVNTEDIETTTQFEIIQTTNEITEFTIENWVYYEDEATPVIKVKYGQETIKYTYSTSENGTFTNELPVNAGKYYIKASIAETSNYKYIEKVISFEIEKATVELPILSSKVYTGKTLIADNYISEYFVVNENKGGINVGSYEVELKLRNPNNYKWVNTENETTIVTFEITQATTIIENLLIENWTYNETNNNPSATTNFGTIVYTYSKTLDGEYSITVPTEAGTYYVKASVEGNENYTSASITTTFTINKAIVNIPTIANVVYNGELQIANVPSSEIYKVVENNGGIDVGKYDVILKLTDASNYKWSNNEEDSQVIIDFIITQTLNSWIITPTLNNWTFKDESNNPIYEPMFGTVLVEYKLHNELDSKYTTQVPINAGKYVARFTVEENEDYGKLEEFVEFEILPLAVIKPNEDINVYTYNEQEQTYRVEENEAYKVSGNVKENAGTYNVTISLVNSNYVWDDGTTTALTYEFVINKQVVELPTINSKVYTGNKQIADVAENDLYVVSVNNGGILVNNDYVVILKLTDSNNYKWFNTEEDTTTLTFEITQATTIIENLTLENWTYNETNNNPSATTNFGTIVYTYSKTLDGEYSITVPTEAGTYYVKASVEGNENYTSASITTTFTINKAVVSVPTISNIVYNGELQRVNVTTNSLYEIVEYEGFLNVGSYEIALKLTDYSNYKWTDTEGDTTTVTFDITQATTIIENLSIENWTYNENNNNPSATTNFGTIVYTYSKTLDGEYSITVPTEAGTYYVKASVEGNENYTSASITTTFIINKAVVNVPVVEDEVYTGETVVSRIESTDIYIVTTNEGGVFVGKYKVTLTLIDADNYCWSRSESHSSVDVEYNIIQSENEWIIIPTISNSTFGLTPTIEFEPKFGEVIVEYKLAGSADETYTQDVPTNVGNYVVRFSVYNTDNYKGLSITSDYEIKPQTINKPNKDTNVYTYNEQEQMYIVEENDAYTVSGNVKENAGTYNVTISLVNSNYVWDDGTTTALTYEFVINKQVVELPTINSKVYTSLEQYIDLEVNPLYTIGEYSGIVNVGSYDITLSLRDSNNYKWFNTEEDTTTVIFEITQATTIIENLTLENWTYNENNNNPSATTNFGTIVYTYSKTLDGEYSITVPTEAGTYYVKASVEGNANYTSASITTTFIINKAVVSVPTISNIIYNGELQKANVPTNVLYEVVENNGGIDAGTYKVILNLLDASNYKWNNNTFENVEISYKILQANNEWIINPSIQESWIYGTENYEIVYQAKFGNVIVEYKLSIDDNSTYTTIEPTSVGVYDVRFTVIETENYTKLVTYDCFEITKKSITKPTQDSTEYVYNGGEQIYVINENPAYNVNGNKQIYAGTYDVVISLSSDNYIWDDQTTNNVVYKFTIKKQNVTIPGESSKPYTGGLLIADESSYNKELYTVINNGGTDVGNYVVILTLKDIENYIWENGNASSIEIGFNITKTTNEITDLTLENWTFNQTANQPTSAAKFGINTVQYLYSNEYDGEYSQVVPTYAGTYYVKAVIDGTSNYESTSLIKEFTINKAIVNEPTIPSKVYSGTLLKAEINNTSLYDVVENNGGSNVGIYNVSLKLVDSNNYKWSTTNNDTVIVKFEITKAPIAIPTANSIEYTGQTIVSDIANTDMYTVTRNDGGINVGSYEIVLSLVNSENYKWADTDDVNKTIYFNITQSQAVINTLTAYNWVYAETPKTPTVVSNYGSDTVIFKYSTTLNGEYTSTIPTDVRTYYVKAIIPETANYKSAEKTTTFDITIATTVMTNLQIVGWTYGQTPNTPTVEINAGIPEFLYSSSYNGVYTSTVPTNAGTYYVKAVVTETTNYTGDETTPIQFVISKADPVVNWPTYSGDNYEDKFDPIKQNNGTTNVTGIFTFSDIYFGMGQTSTNGGYSSAANGISSPLNIVFTPNDISNYNVISTTINVLLKPVAHIGTTYYGTIEKALDNAVSGNTIYIEVGSNPILKESKEIKENVMLAITYQGETIDNGVATLMGSYAPSILDSTLLKNTLTINENVTLTNRGTLTICGVLSGGQGGYVYGGNTGGEYTRILMKQSSRIDNFGTINCYGYIEEETLNNNSEVIMKSGSKMYMPFILRDFHGGTGITAIYNGYKKSILSIGEANISVFNQFEFSNVTAKTVYNHGSNMYAFGNLTANSQVNNCTINLIGTTNQYLIQLNDSVYSKLIYKFNRDSTNIADGICNIDFYGGAVINKLEMELAGTDVDTSTVYFPLSFRFNISFNKGVDSLGNEQTSNAVFSSGQKYKLLPGARMVVNSGVELTLGELNIYDSWNHDVAYVSGGQTNYPQGKSPAQLIVNGKLTINSIGGKIYSNVNGAQIVVNTNAKLTTYEAKTLKNLSVLSYLTDRYTFTYNLQLGSLDNTTLTTISSKGTYTYNNGSWS